MTELQFEKQRELVMARFKTLDQSAKISLGGEGEITVGDLIKHVESGDQFGRKIVQVQIKTLQVLTSV